MNGWIEKPCGVRVLSLDLEGWHLCASLGRRSSDPPPHASVLVQTIVVCPENFAHVQLARLRADDPDTTVLDRHAAEECRRVLRGFVSLEGDDEAVALREIDGSRPRHGAGSPGILGNLAKGVMLGLDGEHVQDPEIDARMSREAVDRPPRLGDVVMRRIDGDDRGSHRRSTSILPSYRRAVQACLADHPWVAFLTATGNGRRIAHALRSAGPRRWSPAALAALQASLPGARVPWTGAAVACMDAFWGVEPGPGVPARRPPIEFLSMLPPEWMPRDPAAFAAASEMSDLWFRRWSLDAAGSPTGIRVLLAGSGGRWEEILRRTVEAAGVRDAKTAFEGIGDMVRHVAERIVDPCLRSAEIDAGRVLFPDGIDGWEDSVSERTARILVSSDAGLVEMARRSARWHAAHRTLPVPVRMPVRTWPALTEDHREGDLVLTFLRSDAELDEEGAAMRHCVGSYARRCAERGVHIASIRRAGERLSTVEVGTEGGAVVVRQHRSVGNGHPPGEAGGVLSRWFGRVMDRNLPVDPEAMRGMRMPTDEIYEVPRSGSPSDWRGILQRRIASMSWGELRTETVDVALRLVGSSRFGSEIGHDHGSSGPFGF